MPSSSVSDFSLPRKLKSPFLTFFFIFTLVYVLALGIAGGVWVMSDERAPFDLIGMLGGSIWVGFAIGACASWQILTICDNRLVFNSFGKKTTVFYKDVEGVEVIQKGPQDENVETMTLYLSHRGRGKNPMILNLGLFGDKDRIFLLRLIKTSAPDARLNFLAEHLSQK